MTENVVDIAAFRAELGREKENIPRTTLEKNGGGSDNGGMDLTQRVASLEKSMEEVKNLLQPLSVRVAEMHGLLTGTLPNLATKAEVADKPGKGYMWTILGVLTALILGAVALGASLVK